MGLYINPLNQSKEEFLAAHGKLVSVGATLAHVSFSNAIPVILVDNYTFTAAAVGYSAREIAAFFHPEDLRPKQCWLLPREAVCDGASITMEMLDELTGK